MHARFLFSFFAVCLLGACASSIKHFDADADFSERVGEARRIIDNSRAYSFKPENEQQLLDGLSFFAPPFQEEQPTEPDLSNPLLSAFEKEKLTNQYEKEMSRWRDDQQSLLDSAAKVRQASVKLLGRNPSPSTFKAIVAMLFDPDAGVRKEAAAVVRRSRAVTAPVLYETASSSDLEDTERQILVDKLLTFGDAGEPWLIELLGNYDDTISQMAAQALFTRYPQYPAQKIDYYSSSSLPENRFKMPFWLIFYQNEQSLKNLLTLMGDSNQDVVQRAQEAFSSLGRWSINYLLVFLRQHDYDEARLIMIDKVCEYNDDRGMAYLGELFNSNEFFSKANFYAKRYSVRFLRYIRQLFYSDNKKIVLSAIQIASLYQDKETALAAVDLLSSNDRNIAQAAKDYLLSAVPYAEEELAARFTPGSMSKSAALLIPLLVSRNSTAILYNQEKKLSFTKLNYLFITLDEKVWFTYVDNQKNSKLQLQLQSLYSLYKQIILIKQQGNSFSQSSLVTEAVYLSQELQQLNSLQKNNNQQLNSFLGNSNQNSFINLNNRRLAFNRRLSHWSALKSAAGRNDLSVFQQFSSLYKEIYKNYQLIEPENKAIAASLISYHQLSLPFIEAFISLGL